MGIERRTDHYRKRPYVAFGCCRAKRSLTEVAFRYTKTKGTMKPWLGPNLFSVSDLIPAVPALGNLLVRRRAVPRRVFTSRMVMMEVTPKYH